MPHDIKPNAKIDLIEIYLSSWWANLYNKSVIYILKSVKPIIVNIIGIVHFIYILQYYNIWCIILIIIFLPITSGTAMKQAPIKLKLIFNIFYSSFKLSNF